MLVDKVKFLVGELSKKNGIVISIQTSLSASKFTLARENSVQDPSHNKAAEIKASLKEAQEILHNIHLKNLTLTKEFDKVVDKGLSFAYDSFGNVLQQEEHLFPPLRVSRERVLPDQEIEDGKVVSLKDQ